ncbi:MAG: hypothetical protein ABI480_06135 [Chitinophagaceae bacterium]
MKKVIFIIVCFLVTITSFSQQTKSSLTKEDYLLKSKNQRTAGRILLIGGGVLIGTAVIIGSSGDRSFDDAATLGIVGVIGAVSAISSIPLFIASSRNKKKAKAMTANFKMERIAPFQPQVLSYHSYPALSVRINL